MPAQVKHRIVWTSKDAAAAWDWASALLLTSIKPEITRMSLVEWAETRRVIPSGLSSMPGLFSWDVTPYLEEIADDLSETSPVREVAVMKGTQVGFTVGILENWMLYTIDQAPGPMLYVAQSQQAVEKNMAERLTPAIVQSGLEHKVFAQAKPKGSRKTGNTDDSKQFPGGRIRAIGPNMGARARSDSYQKGAFDELDAWPQEIGSDTGKRKNEGSTIEVLKRRFDAFINTMKVCYGSTPLDKGTSLIEPLFEEGDQRLYHVPCKHCGELQPLEWEQVKFDKEEDGNLVFEKNATGEKIIGTGHVWYECRACGGRWVNADKVDFLKSERQGGRARWVPTAEARTPGMRSYHIPSLMAPVGFRDWEACVLDFIKAGKDPTKLKAFWNTTLGRTWEHRESRIEYTKLMLHRDGEPDVYTEWPEAARFITIGADVQGDRIEAEVVAWGPGNVSWSLDYLVFPGDTTDLGSSAWSGLRDLITREHLGKLALCTLVDAGFISDVVYAFCDQVQGQGGMVHPVMGESVQNDKIKLFTMRDTGRGGVKRCDVQTGQLKLELMRHLRRDMPEVSRENPVAMVPEGYCHFPGNRTEKYFRMLTAEERVPKKMPNGGTKMVWQKIHGRNRNEALDCRVYAMAALNIVRTSIVAELELEDEGVTWADFWKILDA